MELMEIHKFGKFCLDSKEGYIKAAQLIAKVHEQNSVVVVASAMAGVTDRLIELSVSAAAGEKEDSLKQVFELSQNHLELLSEFDQPDDTIRDQMLELRQELTDLVSGVALLSQLTPRIKDRILAVGEKLSARIFKAALESLKVKAQVMDADGFIETDDHFGEANLIASVADRTINAKINPCLENKQVPVVTGFCGRAPDGATTTLGRGSSDLTATFIAATLGAKEVTLWTNRDGIYTADNQLVEEARVISHLNYREAAEMSFYGDKLLHQRSIIPAASASIPIRIRNLFSLDAPGTVIDKRYALQEHPVKAVCAIGEHCLVSIEGKGMAGLPGIAARVFSAIAEKKISVTMISQSSSESNICLGMPTKSAGLAESALKQEFQSDIGQGDIEEIVIRQNVALVAVVGLGMANSPGVAGRVFSVLGDKQVNVLAIAQGSSELNISLAVEQEQLAQALNALHKEFEL
jgi:aspartate kinase